MIRVGYGVVSAKMSMG